MRKGPERWYSITTHEVAIMVKITKRDMEKYGMYQCTNKVKEDMVGWVTIWKKMDPDALKKQDKWRGREIMVLVDSKHEHENIMNFYADSSLSQRAAQRSGCIPEKCRNGTERWKKK